MLTARRPWRFGRIFTSILVFCITLPEICDTFFAPPTSSLNQAAHWLDSTGGSTDFKAKSGKRPTIYMCKCPNDDKMQAGILGATRWFGCSGIHRRLALAQMALLVTAVLPFAISAEPSLTRDKVPMLGIGVDEEEARILPRLKFGATKGHLRVAWSLQRRTCAGC